MYRFYTRTKLIRHDRQSFLKFKFISQTSIDCVTHFHSIIFLPKLILHVYNIRFHEKNPKNLFFLECTQTCLTLFHDPAFAISPARTRWPPRVLWYHFFCFVVIGVIENSIQYFFCLKNSKAIQCEITANQLFLV